MCTYCWYKNDYAITIAKFKKICVELLKRDVELKPVVRKKPTKQGQIVVKKMIEANPNNVRVCVRIE